MSFPSIIASKGRESQARPGQAGSSIAGGGGGEGGEADQEMILRSTLEGATQVHLPALRRTAGFAECSAIPSRSGVSPELLEASLRLLTPPQMHRPLQEAQLPPCLQRPEAHCSARPQARKEV